MVNGKNTIGVLIIVVLLVGLIPTSAARADLSPGNLDTGFYPGSGANEVVRALTIQPDGKVLIGGSFTEVAGPARSYIARLNVDGSLDSSFYSGDGPNRAVNSLALQPDGKVLIGGRFWEVDGEFRNHIARLNADGSLDSSFDPKGSTSEQIYPMALQPDGKVLVGGFFTQVDGVTRNRIARLNADGSLDNSFDPKGGPNNAVLALTVQPDGKVLIGGAFTEVDGVLRSRIARLNADGSLDSSFDPGIGANDHVFALTVQPDGKVLIGGDFTEVDSVARIRIARLNADGLLDSGFESGAGANKTVWSLALQPDGKVLIGGYFTEVDGVARNRIARLKSNGSLDSSFDPRTGPDGSVHTVGLQTNGKVLIGGYFTDVDGVSRNRIARVNADGSLDVGLKGIGFGPDSPRIVELALQPDSKIIIAGQFSEVNGVGHSSIARLNADGSLDSTFDPGSGANNIVYAVALQPDGKVLIGGGFTTVDGQPRAGLTRLKADGSLDGTFNVNLGWGLGDPVVSDITLMDDGQILIGGSFADVNGIEKAGMAKLNHDGSLDSSFTYGNGLAVDRIVVQPDGMILIAVSGHLIRLNTDGSQDTDFQDQGFDSNPITDMAVLPNGRIIIGGGFTTLKGGIRNRIARLNADGDLDVSFDPGTGANDDVYDVLLQPDGKILIAGNFTTVDGESRIGVARMNADGSLDEDFASQVSHTIVHTLALQPDGKVLGGGEFLIFDFGNVYFNLVRLNGATPPEITSSAPGSTVIVGDTIDHIFTASGFPLPTYSISWGSLPLGLTIDTSSGALSGTFTGTGKYIFELTANNYMAPSDTQAVVFAVDKADTTIMISSVSPDPSVAGETVVVSYTVSDPGSAASGEVTVSDGQQSCTGTVAEGSCEMKFTEVGEVTLTAVYEGDDNYNPSVSAGVQHIVEAVEIPVTGGGLIYLPAVMMGE